MATNALASIPGTLSRDEAYRNRWIIAVTVTLASILEILDTSIVNVAIPHMMGTLGATLDQIAWVSTGYIVANVIVLPITGWLSAYFGRRRYFAGSIALFTFASFMCGNSHTLAELLTWRIVQGIGGGALLSTSQAILYEVFPPHEYGQAMAIFGIGVMVGPTLGPTLGGWITDTLSWTWIFYINLPFGALAFLFSITYIRNSPFARKVASIDWPGMMLLVLAVGSLQTMLERGERQDWFSSREIVLYAVTTVTAHVLFVWRELTCEHPVVDLRILLNRQFATGTLLGAMLGMCLYATVFVLPVYLQQLQGFTANQTGLVILPGALASAATMPLMVRLLGKVDLRVVASIGATLFALAMFEWSHFTLQSGVADYFWPLITRGVALGLVFIPLNNLAMVELPMSRIADGTGFYNLSRQLGGSIGIAVSATLVQRFTTQSRAALAQHVTSFDTATQMQLDRVTQSLLAAGQPLATAKAGALASIVGAVQREATMLAFEKIFLLFGCFFLIVLPLSATLRWDSKKLRGGADAH